MLKWIDVAPTDWFYRDLLEADRIIIDPENLHTKLVSSIAYNIFEVPRVVKTFISEDGQREFTVPGLVNRSDNKVTVYVDGIPALVEKIEGETVTLVNPLASGMEVVIVSSGVPKMYTGPWCGLRPGHNGEDSAYPRAELSRKDLYTYNPYYSRNESCVVFGRRLKRIDVTIQPFEDIEDVLRRVIGHRDDVYTIIDGVLYVPYNYNNLPINVCYNYQDTEGNVYNYCEKVVVSSPTGLVSYTDRFFPKVKVLRAEFLIFLHRIKVALHNRFTDRKYYLNTSNERNVPDVDVASWYGPTVLDMLNDKYLDGCYVFPLYSDGTFRPMNCITRAESMVYLNRFIEWSLERFR